MAQAKKVKIKVKLPSPGISDLERNLCETLLGHSGERGVENEDMLSTLERIIRERDAAFEKLALLTIQPSFNFFFPGWAKI